MTLALGVAAGAHAQGKRDTTYLPVWNQNNGKLEYLLQLEPADRAGMRFKSGANTFDATLGLDSGDGLGLVCDRKSGLSGAIGNLANNCLLATLDEDRDNNRQFSAGASLSRPGGRVGVSLGNGRDTLPAWMSPNGRTSRVDQNTLTVYGQKNIGREAMVSIGGTWARAKLIPAGELPNLADHWNSKSITLGAAYGNFGANIVGRVVDTPGQPGQWEGLGVGLTWRTPWSGQLTVGAENVVTRGKNPFAPGNGEKDEGTVPYVRYEQDL
ncbi:hypothetical protein J5226_23925 [Lysobacter sp. K5869]|nr:hypothetical protein J5226_23925 [Lysobacter sp. K5869]